MHQYLIDTEFASRGVISLMNHDRQAVAELNEKQRAALQKEAAFDLQFLQRQMQPHANYWHGLLVEAVEERMALDRQIAVFEAEILDKKHSLATLAAAQLQIAKQGISSVKGVPDNCPSGRVINGVELRWVIWAGRNQAQHFEEPRKIDDVTAGVFARLNDHPGASPLPNPRSRVNLAYEVVVLLGWLDYATYERDMVSLIG